VRDVEDRRTLDRDQAMAALAAGPGLKTPAMEWALNEKVGVRISGRYVPLATATPELIREFEEEASNRGRGLESLPPLDGVQPAMR
jgi:hypothetical protein